MNQPSLVVDEQHLSAGRQKAVVSAVIGNALEWYDFGLFAFFATTIAKTFFPAGDEMTALLYTFGTFGVGLLARPLGGILFGRYADLRGRKPALILTVVLMGLGTFMIGIIPGHSTIGFAAPVLLFLARLLQGFSAGGEWGGATTFLVEWAPPNKRGLYGSFQQFSVLSGVLLGSGVGGLFATIFEPEALDSWAWRIPFMLGGVLALFGLYLRKNVAETPAYLQTTTMPDTEERKGGIVVGRVARAFGFSIAWNVMGFFFLYYMPTFAQTQLHIPRPAALWSNTIGLLVLVCAVPIMGRLSDAIGRKPLLIASCIGAAIIPYPAFRWLVTEPTVQNLIIAQIVFGLLISLYSGPGPAAIAEIFPTRNRSTGMSIGYSIAAAVFGGFAPFIATWLVKETGSPISPTLYVIAAAVISGFVMVQLKETAHEPLA